MVSMIEWIPMYWPCGILEVFRREQSKDFDLSVRDTLEKWKDPNLLSLLAGSPVNCLIFPWSAGLPEDSRHQHELIPLIKGCRDLDISLVGVVGSQADFSAATDSARKAGLSALAMEKIVEKGSSLPIIPWTERSRIPWNSSQGVVALNKGVWPGIRGSYHSPEEAAEAGPTPNPWIDSNGWIIQLARAQGPGMKIWMDLKPTGKGQPLRVESYVLAVADSAAFGARWVISLDDHMREALIQKGPGAIYDWKKILHAISFFRDHQDWQPFETEAVVGVVSNFTGENEYLSEEVLNLANRRQLPFRVILKARCTRQSLERLKAALYVDLQPPDEELRQQLLSFVESGGLLIVLPAWGRMEGMHGSDALDGRFLVFLQGHGRLAMAKEVPEDPYVLAADVHMLVSRRNDLIRIYNGSAMTISYSVTPRSGTSLVQLVDYSGWNSSEAVSVWMKRTFTSADFWSLNSDTPERLSGVGARDGVEVHLPRFSVYGALEERVS